MKAVAHPQAATLYADPAVLESWRERGGHPPTVVYASGERVDPANPCAAMVRRWIDAGAVITHQQRGSDGVLRHLLALRPSTLPGMNAAESERAEAELGARDRRMLQVLRDLEGEALPCNRELARRAGISGGAEAANYRLKKLERAGMIRRTWLERPDGAKLRFVAVCA